MKAWFKKTPIIHIKKPFKTQRYTTAVQWKTTTKIGFEALGQSLHG